MRIITRLNIGGPAIHALLLTREMTALGYRALLLAGSCEAGEKQVQTSRDRDFIRWVPELSRPVNPWRNARALWRLWRILRDERPDIVHTHTAMAGCLGRLAAILNGTPVVVHTFHGNSLAEYFSPNVAEIFRRIEQLLARFTGVLCVVSPQQARELSGKFQIARPSRFRVVPLGLELDDYFCLNPPNPDQPFTVGWFGRMAPVKNVALLTATIDRALRLDSGMRFVIAGDGQDRSLLDSLAASHSDRVECLGWQTEMLPVMARCHVLLQTSRNEGTPVALIQGMAAARPFVSTAVGGVVDMVTELDHEDAGQRWFANGVLAASDPNAIAGALISFAGNRALVSQMGAAGRTLAAQRYRKETLVRNLDLLYRELLAGRRKPWTY